MGTATQYFGGVKNQLQFKYKGYPLWKEWDWCNLIRDGIEENVTRRCIEEGVLVRDKSPEVRSSLVFVFVYLYMFTTSTTTITFVSSVF